MWSWSWSWWVAVEDGEGNTEGRWRTGPGLRMVREMIPE